MAVGALKQDEFTQEQVSEMFKKKAFERGSYEVSVGPTPDCKVKISRIQKRWVQNEDVS